MSAKTRQVADTLNEENRFVYETDKELPSLQNQASFRVTLSIWNSYLLRLKRPDPPSIYEEHKFEKSLFLFDSYEEDTDKLIEDLGTPPRIETLLKSSLKKVRDEMKQCVEHFREVLWRFSGYNSSSDSRHSSSYFDSNWCVWLPNGEIDYQKTAKKILSAANDQLNEAQKFTVMYDCCLEDEARALSLDSLPDNIASSHYQLNDCVVEWWLAYLRNKPTEYKIRCGEWGNDRRTSWPFTGIVAECKIDRTSAIRINHFWHRLTDEDQVLAVYNMIVNRPTAYLEKWQIVEPLIGSMSLEQQRSLLSMPRAALKIVEFSWQLSSSSDCMVWAWKNCRDFIIEKDFNYILEGAFGERNEQALSNAVTLWDNFYDHHKEYFLSHKDGVGSLSVHSFFSSTFLRTDIPLTPAAYQLFDKYVSSMKSPEQRVTFILHYSLQLAERVNDPDDLRRLFDSHLPCLEDQKKFKTLVTSSREIEWYFIKLWCRGDFDVLDANLNFYFDGDMDAARKYKRKILMSIISDNWPVGNVVTNADKWNICSQLIDEVLSDDPAEAFVAKQQFVSRFFLPFSDKKHLHRRFNQAVKIFETFSPNKEEVRRLKTKFITDRGIPKLCEDVYFHEVVDWCCDDNDEAIAIFKDKFKSQDDIFDAVFLQLNKTYVTEGKGLKKSLLGRLDKYLSWYLDDEQQVNEYKVRRLIECDSFDIFRTIRRQKDEPSLQILLGWFFNGDYAKIRDFCSKEMKC